MAHSKMMHVGMQDDLKYQYNITVLKKKEKKNERYCYEIQPRFTTPEQCYTCESQWVVVPATLSLGLIFEYLACMRHVESLVHMESLHSRLWKNMLMHHLEPHWKVNPMPLFTLPHLWPVHTAALIVATPPNLPMPHSPTVCQLMVGTQRKN